MLVKSQMRELLRIGLGNLTEKDMTDPEADLLLDLSFTAIWMKYEFKERECRAFIETQEGVSEYRLDEDNIFDSLITVAIKDGAKTDEGQWKKLLKTEWDPYDETHDTSVESRAKPTRFHRLQHTLIVDPVPDATIYTLRLIYYRTLDTFVQGKAEITSLPPQWDEIVVEGAISRGHFYRQDYNEAAAAQNFQGVHIRDAVLIREHELRDVRYARLEVLHDDPEDQ